MFFAQFYSLKTKSFLFSFNQFFVLKLYNKEKENFFLSYLFTLQYITADLQLPNFCFCFFVIVGRPTTLVFFFISIKPQQTQSFLLLDDFKKVWKTMNEKKNQNQNTKIQRIKKKIAPSSYSDNFI